MGAKIILLLEVDLIVLVLASPGLPLNSPLDLHENTSLPRVQLRNPVELVARLREGVRVVVLDGRDELVAELCARVRG